MPSDRSVRELSQKDRRARAWFVFFGSRRLSTLFISVAIIISMGNTLFHAFGSAAFAHGPMLPVDHPIGRAYSYL
jgi:CBS domain containing-hemolysin-like protein